MFGIKILSGDAKMPENPVITFSYECDNWQKHSFNAIHNGDDLLINVPTSSGKTTSAIYAILFCVLVQKKRAIYTTPIKSLSNEKYNEFAEKFAEHGITVGIMTGDNKINPDADVIMVTAEILRNSLYKNEDKLEEELNENTKHKLGGGISNFVSTIGCVIMDEIHYMNDKDRGRVWEETIIMLPKSIQLIMLSGTVGNREYFAKWISNCREKNVSIIYESKRVIPLKHYVYVGKKLYEYYDEKECYQSQNYNGAKKKFEEIKKELEKKHKFYDEKADILSMVNYLKDNDMLQAIIFSFSRKDCEKYADMVSSMNFLDQEEKKQIDYWFYKYIGNQKDEKGNYKFENIDNVRKIKELLDRGVAYHHSTMLQNVRELIEILMKKKLIKVLFATETLCIGVNVPAKTCVFTGIIKPTGKGRRTLNTSEYRQMAGRAGRRGLDTIGNVILLPLREIPYEGDVQSICTGFNPPIRSNFQLDYQTILKLAQTSNVNPFDIFCKSLMNYENLDNVKNANKEKEILCEEKVKSQDKYKNYEITEEELNRLKNLLDYDIEKDSQSNIKLTKKQEQEYKELKSFVMGKHKEYYNYMKKLHELETKITMIESKITSYQEEIVCLYKKYRVVLEELEYVKTSESDYIQKEDTMLYGVVCSQINDCDVILLTEMVKNNIFNNLSCEEIISLLSVFTEPIQKDKKCDLHEFDGTDNLHSCVDKINTIKNKIEDIQKKSFGQDYELLKEISICTDYMDMACDWGSGKTVYDMTAYFSEYEIPEESFCKAMTKIGNIIQYLVNIYKVLKTNIELIPLLEKAQTKVIRDIVCTTSLYLLFFYFTQK
jgi:superfamily II RNA helicase